MSASWIRGKSGRLLLVLVLLGFTGIGLLMVARPLLAEYYVRRAERALEKQRYPEALQAYQEALTYRPDSPRLHLLVARTARRAGNLTTAREHIQLCRDLQGGVTEEQQLEAYMLRAQSGELTEVEPYLLPYLLQEGPLTPLVLESLANAYLARFQVTPAWQCLSRWNELEPNNVEALFRRGIWHVRQQDLKKGAADLRKALEIDPQRTDIRMAYAEILRSEKEYGEVAEQYQLVLNQSPTNSKALIGLAQTYVQLGKPNDARGLLDLLPEDQKGAAAALWLRGMVELRTDHPAAAVPLFQAALAKEPRHSEACYNLMLSLSQLKRLEEAEAARKRFERIEADDQRLIQLTTRELSERPTDPDLRCELGELYLRMGHPQRGIRWLYAALKVDPKCHRAHEQLLHYYEKQTGPDAEEKAAYHRRELAKPG